MPDLVAGVVLAVLALGGGRSRVGLLRPVLRCISLAPRSAGAVARQLTTVLPGAARFLPVLRAAALTVVLLGVFGALFASADRVFGTLLARFLVPDVDLGLLPARLVGLAAVATGAATLLRLRRDPDEDGPMAPTPRQLRGVEWQVPLAGLVLLFAVFVTLQFSVLFGGHERVLKTAGLTYADYARGGFAQLVVVALLTLVVIGATDSYAAPCGERETRLQRGLLAGLCGMTFVVLASALHRLLLYQEAFGFTRLRFGALAVIWWLAAMFALVLIGGAARRTHLLPRAMALLTAVAVLTVGYVQPDAVIARWNVERFHDGGDVDVAYLAGLSADAAPALLALPAELRRPALEVQLRKLEDAETWAGWNLSRARARTATRRG